MDCIIECLYPSVFIAVVTSFTAVYAQTVEEVSGVTMRTELKGTKEITKVGLKRLNLSVINGLEKLETNTEFSGGNDLIYGKRKVQKELGVQY